MALLLLMSVFLVLLVAGVPIGLCLGCSGVLALYVFDLGFEMAGVNFISGIASFPLLAIPFFILSGVILERAGLAREIAAFFERLLGGRVGGMAMVAVMTCIFWGAISGSGPATTAAVGLILLAPMLRQGYPPDFSAALIANASDLSIVIPPSIAFVLYGSLTGASIGGLFLAGVLPGVLTGLALLVVAYVISRRQGYRGAAAPTPRKDLGRLFLRALWALLTPVIILGGIYSGIFTPTEAAVVAVFYSLFIAGVVYRTLSWRILLDILVEAAVMSSVIMFVVAFAGIFSWAATMTGALDRLAGGLAALAAGPLSLVLLVCVLLLVLGLFLDAISITYLLLPVLLPVLQKFQVDLTWFGVVFVCALAIGQATPPVGVNLFAAANLAGRELDGVARAAIPFVLAATLALVLIVLWPALSLWLPGLLRP